MSRDLVSTMLRDYTSDGWTGALRNCYSPHRPVEFTVYTSAAYAELAEEYKVKLSVGRTGVCWDNAVAESFFSMLKNEMYYRHKFPTRGRARFAVMDYIEVFYNRDRLHSTLEYRTPVEVRHEYEQSMNPQIAVAA